MPLKNHELLFYVGTNNNLCFYESFEFAATAIRISSVSSPVKVFKVTKLSLFARNKSERYKISESCIFRREKWKIDTNL